MDLDFAGDLRNQKPCSDVVFTVTHNAAVLRDVRKVARASRQDVELLPIQVDMHCKRVDCIFSRPTGALIFGL
jgi:hypothetical protein